MIAIVKENLKLDLSINLGMVKDGCKNLGAK